MITSQTLKIKRLESKLAEANEARLDLALELKRTKQMWYNSINIKGRSYREMAKALYNLRTKLGKPAFDLVMKGIKLQYSESFEGGVYIPSICFKRSR